MAIATESGRQYTRKSSEEGLEQDFNSLHAQREIAAQERGTRSYVSRIINLAFLAPEITEAIVTGLQPAGCTVDRLTKGIDLPVEWTEQRRVIERL